MYDLVSEEGEKGSGLTWVLAREPSIHPSLADPGVMV